jgi:hypothetical protein
MIPSIRRLRFDPVTADTQVVPAPYMTKLVRNDRIQMGLAQPVTQSWLISSGTS